MMPPEPSASSDGARSSIPVHAQLLYTIKLESNKKRQLRRIILVCEAIVISLKPVNPGIVKLVIAVYLQLLGKIIPRQVINVESGRPYMRL